MINLYAQCCFLNKIFLSDMKKVKHHTLSTIKTHHALCQKVKYIVHFANYYIRNSNTYNSNNNNRG